MWSDSQLSTSMPRPQHQHHDCVPSPNVEAEWLGLLGLVFVQQMTLVREVDKSGYILVK